MYPQLLAHIKRYVQLNTQEEKLLCRRLKLMSYPKKAFLLEQGKVCKGNYFVLKGCVRQYLVTNKLVEQVTQFALESWWIADQESLVNMQPSNYYIQALEDCEVLLLTEADREILFEEVPKMEAYFRIMMQKAFIAMQRRVGFMLNMSDEERYRHFVSLYPGFVQRVPQYMLASFLGFTPQFMSRIRAKKV